MNVVYECPACHRRAVVAQGVVYECLGCGRRATAAEHERVDAEAIVRDLAEGGAPWGNELGDCAFCENGPCDRIAPEDHTPDCPWRRAREWVDGQVET